MQGSCRSAGSLYPRITLRTAFGIVGSCGLALVVGACAITNTPQQDLANERWAKCAVPFVRLERVDIDGRITFLFSNAADRRDVLQCLADAGRAGPPLPEPVTVRPAGGP